MVEIADIEDENRLEVWLKDQPRETAVWIASRDALRALPIWWSWALQVRLGDVLAELQQDTLQLLRANTVLRSVLASPENELLDALERAATALDRAVAMATHSFNIAHNPQTAVVANLAGHATMGVATAMIATQRAGAFFASSSGHGADTAAWEAVRTDCATLTSGASLSRTPLWPDRANPLQDRWDAVTARLRDDPPPGGPWDFWRDWYQGLLDGTPMDPDLLTRIALIDPEHWDAGPERVNPMIAEMVAEHAAARTPNAERIVENPETGRLRLEAVSDLTPDRLSEIRAKMLDAAEIFGDTVEGNQPYSALSAEVELVRNAAASEDARPIRLYDVCRRAVRRTQRKAALGECPENDALVEDWVDQLGEAALDLGESDARVQEVVAARAAARLRQAAPEEAASARDGALELAQLSEGELAEELEADAETIADADAPSEERREAQYRLTSRLTRVWLGARRVLRETREVSDDVAGITLNVAKIVGASAAIKKAVTFLSSLM